MSETPPIDPEQAALARLAELDLSLIEHVHAQALATTVPEEINGLGRTYQRIARSLRQTLALKAKLAREDREAALRHPPSTLPQSRRQPQARTPDEGYDLADAVTRVIWDEAEPQEREMLVEQLGERIHDYLDTHDVSSGPMTAHVVRLAVELGLSSDAAAAWEQLPQLPPADMVYWDLDAKEPP